MNRKIKLIWDFKGPDSIKVAEHHCLHLKEYSKSTAIHFYTVSAQKIDKFQSTASVIVDQKDMLSIRDALKPHRAEIAK